MDILQHIAIITTLGIAAHWLAWIFRIPAIILLLLFGFAVGPFSGFIKIDEVMGGLLPPFVSLSVAIIRFEGGLSLKYKDIKTVAYDYHTGQMAEMLVSFLPCFLIIVFNHIFTRFLCHIKGFVSSFEQLELAKVR